LKTLVADAGQGAENRYASSRANQIFMAKYPFLLSVKTHQEIFTDSGNFGITVAGPKEQSGAMADALTKEI